MEGKMRRNNLIVVAIIMSLQLILSQRANAYIDPDTGGFFFQTIAPYVYAVVPLVLLLWALIDILRNEFTGSNKIIWVIIVILIPILGAILYFLIGRKQKVKAQVAKK